MKVHERENRLLGMRAYVFNKLENKTQDRYHRFSMIRDN